MAKNLVSKTEGRAKRAHLWRSARRLIGERGYDAVTMRDLAEHGLVSVPTLYVLFGSKSELLVRRG